MAPPTRKELRKQVREQKKAKKVEHFNAKSTTNTPNTKPVAAGVGRLGQLASTIIKKQVQQSQQGMGQQKHVQQQQKSKGVYFNDDRNTTKEFDKRDSASSISSDAGSVKKRKSSSISSDPTKAKYADSPASAQPVKKMSKLAQMAAALGYNDDDNAEYDSEEGDLDEPVDCDDDDDDGKY